MPAEKGGASYGMQHKLAAARSAEFAIVDSFKLGYRNREDITNLPPGVLIKGSQNVLTNVNERVQLRQGYALDGATSTINAPILGSIDFLTGNNSEAHLRSGFLTTVASANAKVQFRYTDGSWNDLITGLNSSNFNFTTFWKSSEAVPQRVALGVNGDGNVYEWNGAVATINTSTSSTITLNGTTSWLNTGFYASTSPRAIVVGGSVFTYTGGESTTILTGVSPNASGITPNALAHQQYIVTATSTFVGLPSGFVPNLISVLNNQIYLGSTKSASICLSKVNSYTDYSHSTVRQPGEGDTSVVVDENMVGFIVQGVDTAATMYMSAGLDLWYKSVFTAYTDVTNVPGQSFGVGPIKVGKQQGAISQAFMSHMKNYVIMATNETTIDQMGVLENYLTQTTSANLSDPIKLDIDSYNFTDGSIFYFQYNIYVAVPKEGIMLNYSLNTNTWNAPLTIPVSRFYIVDGQLYGHGYNTSESYQLFTGYADRVYPGFAGYPIPADMVFSYQQYGSRHTFKKANALYVEGYISAPTEISAVVTRELDGCANTSTLMISGSDTAIVCIPTEQGSLGKTSLGKQKLGGAGSSSIQGLPPKFRVKKTFPSTNFVEASVSLSCLGINQNFQLLAFGLNAGQAYEETVSITQ